MLSWRRTNQPDQEEGLAGCYRYLPDPKTKEGMQGLQTPNTRKCRKLETLLPNSEFCVEASERYTYLNNLKFSLQTKGDLYSSNEFVEEIFDSDPSLVKHPMMLCALYIGATKSNNKAMRVELVEASTETTQRSREDTERQGNLRGIQRANLPERIHNTSI